MHSRGAAQRAVSLNKESIGHRYVELFRISRSEALDRLGFNPHMMPGAPSMRQVGRSGDARWTESPGAPLAACVRGRPDSTVPAPNAVILARLWLASPRITWDHLWRLAPPQR